LVDVTLVEEIAHGSLANADLVDGVGLFQAAPLDSLLRTLR
jgi:hypothetical protein